MKDLDEHTYNVIIEKLREAGWDNEWSRQPPKFGDTPISWIEAELSHRVKEK